MWWKKKKYTCSICGQDHGEWPALGFKEPNSYVGLTDEEKQTIAEVSSDFCVIKYPDQTDRFIRVVLIQKIVGFSQTLDYGVWVSLSEKSYADYRQNYRRKDYEVKYFGWLNTFLPDYENTLSIPTTVHTQKGNARPYIVPHQNFDHPLVRDYHYGISLVEAERRLHAMLGDQ